MKQYKVMLSTIAYIDANNSEEAIRIAKNGKYNDGVEVGYEEIDVPSVVLVKEAV